MSNGWHTQPGKREGSVARKKGCDMTRSVWRKRLKITGLLLSIMMLGLWVFSVMFMTTYERRSSRWKFGTAMGQIVVMYSHLHGIDPGLRCKRSYPSWKGRTWIEFARYRLGLGLPRKDARRFVIPSWLPVVVSMKRIMPPKCEMPTMSWRTSAA